MWNVQLLNLLPERNGTGNCIVELIRRLSKSVAVCGSHYCRHTRKARHRRGTDHPSKLVPRKSKLNRCIAGFINLCQFFCKCPCVFDSLATSLAHVGLHRVSCVANEGRVAVTPNEGWASVIDVSTFNLFHWRRLNTVHYHRVPSIVEIETNCLTIGTFVFHPWFLCFHCVPLAHSTTNVGGHKVLPIPKEDLIAYCFDVCRLISSNTRIACVAREARLVPLLQIHVVSELFYCLPQQQLEFSTSPNMVLRTFDRMPSAPIKISPFTLVPSVKIASTPPSGKFVYVTTSLPLVTVLSSRRSYRRSRSS
mmetsp:Transcript_12947/g.47341  ORF Transcript_12947/g.47341 Transcript_12947/m.47341 type:complete len:308 (-) Transcript_12947:624-1547(-)